MSLYELYRCHRKDGSSKDWALRINPDGSITTRWGRTGRQLVSYQTRKVNLNVLKRSKSEKGYVLVGTFDIDGSGRVRSRTAVDPKVTISSQTMTIEWHLCLGPMASIDDLVEWRLSVIRDFQNHKIYLEESRLPAPFISGRGRMEDVGEALLLGMLMLKQRIPLGVSLIIKDGDGCELGLDSGSDLRCIKKLGRIAPSLGFALKALGLCDSPIDLRMAIVSQVDRWF